MPSCRRSNILTPDGTEDGAVDEAILSVDNGDEDQGGAIKTLRSAVVCAVAGVRAVTQLFPLAATLDAAAFAWAEDPSVSQFGTQVDELLRDRMTGSWPLPRGSGGRRASRPRVRVPCEVPTADLSSHYALTRSSVDR